MSIATRAATCTSCGKRLNRKRWYYRNGKYFCKQRCWVTEQEKAAKDAAKADAAKAAKDAETPPAGGAGGSQQPQETREKPASP